MQTEHFALQLNKQEALDCLQALLTQTLLEEEIRSQKGLETPEPSPIITRLLAILNCDDTILNNITEKAGDELWEYSWYTFTNEWAWHRAKQDAKKEHKNTKNITLNNEDHHKKAEMLYSTRFEQYVAELNMQNPKINKHKP